MQAGVPYAGYTAILGLVILVLGVALWAIEGPGGYHLHPEKKAVKFLIDSYEPNRLHDDGHHSLMVNNKKLLMWLFLGSDCMFFGTLISTHLIYRKLYPEEFEPTQLFSLELTSFSTFILLMSSLLWLYPSPRCTRGK